MTAPFDKKRGLGRPDTSLTLQGGQALSEPSQYPSKRGRNRHYWDIEDSNNRRLLCYRKIMCLSGPNICTPQAEAKRDLIFQKITKQNYVIHSNA